MGSRLAGGWVSSPCLRASSFELIESIEANDLDLGFGALLLVGAAVRSTPSSSMPGYDWPKREEYEKEG